MCRGRALAGLLLAVLGSSTAWAQGSGRVGLVTGYPASIGVMWRASGSVAIRPDITFSAMSGDSTTTVGSFATTSSGWTVGVGASALFYLRGGDGLRPYISPRFSYGRNSSATDSAPSGAASQNWSNTYSAAGLFGAEYALGRRFAVFGELGVSYARQTSGYRSTAANVIGNDSTANIVSARTALGVILYF